MVNTSVVAGVQSKMNRLIRLRSMGPDLEKMVLPVHSPDRLEAPMDVDVSCDVGSVPQDSEAKIMQCMNNCEDNDFEMENLSDGQAMRASESCKVDITDCGSSPNSGQLEDFPKDVAEYSTSFGDTDSGTRINAGGSDGEVESMYAGGGMSGSFSNGYGDVFALRKKKLTDHWRVFIQPLRWRCKWLELQMKELNAQAINYDNALAKDEEKKHLGVESLNCGDISSKSTENLAQLKRELVMKRRKRKRKEDMDLTSYMSHHNLFSFYDKKPQSDVGLVEACSGSLGLEELLDFGNGTSSLEQLLAKIEMAHLHIRKAKASIEKVIGENPVKFASLNSLIMGVRDTRTGAFPNDASPPLKDTITSPDAIKSPGEAAGNDMEGDNILTKGQAAKLEPVDVDQLKTLPSSKSREHSEIPKADSPGLGVVSELPAEGPSYLEGLNKRSVSTTKTYVRKRRRRGRRTVRPRRHADGTRYK